MSEAVERVKKLFKMPQSLCKKCGQCCKIVCFKGGLSYSEVKKLASSDIKTSKKPSQIEGARDFLSIFLPYKTIEEVRKINSSFVDMFQNRVQKDIKDEQYFYYCRFLSDNNTCMIHEDRPTLCRMYPIPNEGTIFYKDCGYKNQAKKNIQEINNIIEMLKAKE